MAMRRCDKTQFAGLFLLGTSDVFVEYRSSQEILMYKWVIFYFISWIQSGTDIGPSYMFNIVCSLVARLKEIGENIFSRTRYTLDGKEGLNCATAFHAPEYGQYKVFLPITSTQNWFRRILVHCIPKKRKYAYYLHIWPMLDLEIIVFKLAETRYFSAVDLWNCYWQFMSNEE